MSTPEARIPGDGDGAAALMEYFRDEVTRARHTAFFAEFDAEFLAKCLEPMGPHAPWEACRGLSHGAAPRYGHWQADGTLWEFERHPDGIWRLISRRTTEAR